MLYEQNYRIFLLSKSCNITGEIKSCDSANTEMGMTYIYTGNFNVGNAMYSFRKDPETDRVYKIGDIVQIKYNPDNPKENIVDTFDEKYYIIYSIILMLSIFMTTLYLHIRSIKRGKLASL